MFTPEFFIDTVQSTKQSVFRRIVKDEQLRAVADRYIQAQTDFAKMLVSNAIDLAKYSVEILRFPQEEQASQAPYKVEKEAN